MNMEEEKENAIAQAKTTKTETQTTESMASEPKNKPKNIQKSKKGSFLKDLYKDFKKKSPSTKIIVILGGFSVISFIIVGITLAIQGAVEESQNVPPTPTPIPTIDPSQPTPWPTLKKPQTQLHYEYLQSLEFEKSDLLPPELDMRVEI